MKGMITWPKSPTAHRVGESPSVIGRVAAAGLPAKSEEKDGNPGQEIR